MIQFIKINDVMLNTQNCLSVFCVKAATGHEIDDIAFKTGDYGKPLLYRPYNKHLNISHTDGFFGLYR
ncbi:Uncharacterised protein [Staphylococcus gallinarum]|uniref:4'-phosphopantetheinyl transferase n=1 Tax=Staphylococcus gallinarum TaxID=1293 RepID=A0A380FAT2_STAGA|nr:Uncharacterised protein [Staphylococcus gallinarum]